MANYDQFAAAVSEISGGKNVVLLDDVGLPSVYVPFNKVKASELISSGKENAHPAFFVDSVEKDRFFVSKYINVVIGDRAYSLSHRDPKVYVDFDAARKACEAKGTGFHLMTIAEWSVIALWCRKNKTMPHGNSNYGRDEAATHEHGQISYTYMSQDKKYDGRTFTGSGPATWGHDWTQFGIQDMKGNVWEWLGGLRLNDGEIQIIPYNNAAKGSGCDMSAQSTLWKAIGKDGSLIDKGGSDSLKYDFVDSKIHLSTKLTAQADASKSCSYKDMTVDETVGDAPEIAKLLLLYPDEPTTGDYGGDYHWMNNKGERLPLAGGFWYSGAGAGVFALTLGSLRSGSNASLGFRSAYVEL